MARWNVYMRTDKGGKGRGLIKGIPTCREVGLKVVTLAQKSGMFHVSLEFLRYNGSFINKVIDPIPNVILREINLILRQHWLV